MTQLAPTLIGEGCILNLDEEEYQPTERRFSVNLRIRHPTLSPAEITAALGLKPTYVQPVGLQRRGGRGQPLPGVYQRTTWHHSRIFAAPNQWFAAQLIELVEDLMPHGDFFQTVRECGGQTVLELALLDDEYYGDAIPSQLLAKIAGLGLEFGISSYAVPQNVSGSVTILPADRRRLPKF